MHKIELDDETKNKILLCAANILMMHGKLVSNRVFQDWSGSDEKSPESVFTHGELRDLSYNYEVDNSSLEDFSEDYHGMHDEMVASFTIASAIKDLAK